jgi:anti-sigma factor RsiW
MGMQCPIQKENAEVLLDYCARKLNPETTALLNRHMESCAECRAFAAAQMSVWEALDAWEPEPVSAAFDRKLYARIEEREAQKGWLGHMWGRISQPAMFTPFGWRPAMPIAAACLTLVAAFVLSVPGDKSAREIYVDNTRDNGRVEVVDVEQVERTLDDIEMLKQLNPPVKGVAASDSRNL